MAKAKALLEAGASYRKVAAETGLSDWTITRLKRGVYDNKIPASYLEQARASLSSKLTLVASLALDEIVENPDKLRQASAKDLMTTAAIAIDKQELLEGRPTARVDHLVNLSEEELDAEIRQKAIELAKVARRRGHQIDITQYEDAPTPEGAGA